MGEVYRTMELTLTDPTTIVGAKSDTYTPTAKDDIVDDGDRFST